MALPNCIDCKIELKDYRSRRCRSCAKKGSDNPMFGKIGEAHHLHKGGYIHKKSGYRVVRHDGKDTYEHRVVAEKMLGRKLREDEIVHHSNENKLDNRPENLEVITQAEHVSIHKPMLGKKSKVKRDPNTQRFSK